MAGRPDVPRTLAAQEGQNSWTWAHKDWLHGRKPKGSEFRVVHGLRGFGLRHLVCGFLLFVLLYAGFRGVLQGS